MFSNHGAHTRQVPIDKFEVVLRRHAFRERRPASDIGKHHGHLLFYLVSEPDLINTLFIQQADELPWYKAFINEVQFGQFGCSVLDSFL